MLMWTVRVALVLYVAALGGLLAGGRHSGWWHAWRLLWTAGCVTFLGHVGLAFQYHDWSHAVAEKHTAERVQALLGWNFGGGIYFNYLFMLLWISDVAWSWVAAASYRTRPIWVDRGLHAFLLFIAINGAIIFENGPTRPAGLVALGVLSLLLLLSVIRKK